MTTAGDRAGFVHVIRALGEGIRDVMVVGGWAHRLHFLHPLAAPIGDPLHTTDADVLVPAPSPALRIRVASLEAAGFEVKLGGLGASPVTRYVLRPGIVETTTVHAIEFLATRRGGEVVRGRRQTTIRVGDAIAQLLPHLDVMLHEPWFLTLPASEFPTGGETFALAVVSPAPYVAHKLMVLRDRQDRRKRAADVRYLHDSFIRFGARLDELADAWRRRESTAAERRRIVQGRDTALSPELLAGAARIEDLAGRSARPDRIRAVIEQGTAALFDL